MFLLSISALKVCQWAAVVIIGIIYFGAGGIVSTNAPNFITAILAIFFWPLFFVYDAFKN